ncbi:hypothetical protein RchiOBHm_Chr3g0462781 [Rosa chinensis]|uniref:Uncharacterized protein n=1 Tax=Rosa chinensis TaxID=74649 RepID=A0A2P6R920_ROSCH|nr:uncharacterized protein LOC112193871 [Rosa chinensis]XP_024189891.1 uncharacterized protein LOC112193871 [Rosa chinensis]PRQ42912.1 hypothetical protein RchiOBHm_Chr3g0462781 [Rosa chinensis]
MTCSVAFPIPVLRPLVCNKFLYLSNPCISLPKLGYSSLNQNRFRRLSSIDGNNTGSGLSDADSFSSRPEDSSGNSDSGQGGAATSNETLKKLRRYGIAGLLSYGLLNTAYYLTTFLFVWFYVAPTPGRMGYLAAAQRFLKIMAMVWAGSQVTKLIRAGGALALAPFVDRGLSWFTIKFHFESQGKAFAAIVGVCFGLALVLFFAVTLLWA